VGGGPPTLQKLVKMLYIEDVLGDRPAQKESPAWRWAKKKPRDARLFAG
jgi:hypothetical protein